MSKQVEGYVVKMEKHVHDEDSDDGQVSKRPRIPVLLKNNQDKRLIVVLERASLESVKVCDMSCNPCWVFLTCRSALVMLIAGLLSFF